jgi:electron transport complex protein RnfD
VPIIGAFFAIVFVKQLYGGIGKNFLNPALAGRAFLFASYSSIMTRWITPANLADKVDAITMATPLSYMKAGEALPSCFSMVDMFVGRMPGCFGEISAAALLLGGIYLICRKVITWHIPVAFIGTVAVLSLIFGGGEAYSHVDWMVYNLLSGGLMLGAIFMATDYSTSPTGFNARLIYGAGCGILTVVIRRFGGYPEGVSFAILIMNCCAWFLDQLTQRRQFGVSREDVKAKKAAAKAAKKEAKEAAAQ